jgi:hypothetical protein
VLFLCGRLWRPLCNFCCHAYRCVDARLGQVASSALLCSILYDSHDYLLVELFSLSCVPPQLLCERGAFGFGRLARHRQPRGQLERVSCASRRTIFICSTFCLRCSSRGGSNQGLRRKVSPCCKALISNSMYKIGYRPTRIQYSNIANNK